MNVERQDFYPGESDSAQEILALAKEYQRAAETLLAGVRRRAPKSAAPYRLLAIHAVELYLNALLNFRGVSSTKIRGLQHDLASRAKSLKDHDVVLRSGTFEHLERLTGSREYLCARYDAETREKLSELNRLEATLNEVASKVTARIQRG